MARRYFSFRAITPWRAPVAVIACRERTRDLLPHRFAGQHERRFHTRRRCGKISRRAAGGLTWAGKLPPPTRRQRPLCARSSAREFNKRYKTFQRGVDGGTHKRSPADFGPSFTWPGARVDCGAASAARPAISDCVGKSDLPSLSAAASGEGKGRSVAGAVRLLNQRIDRRNVAGYRQGRTELWHPARNYVWRRAGHPRIKADRRREQRRVGRPVRQMELSAELVNYRVVKTQSRG